MKNIVLKGVLLAGLVLFLFKGGIRMLLFGWRLFVPMLVVTVFYLVVRQLLQQKQVSARSRQDKLSSDDPIIICKHCHKPKGSCPKCSS